jgi:hypothetical protein
VLLKDASAWDLLNIPIDEAIDMFDSLLNFIKESGRKNYMPSLQNIIITPESIEQKGITFDHNFGYSFPLFSSLLKKEGRRKGE